MGQKKLEKKIYKIRAKIYKAEEKYSKLSLALATKQRAIVKGFNR